MELLENWHDYFLMVGGGAAALAGLVFVAMSINLGSIIKDATHKNRAIGTLTGFTAVFMTCAFGLLGNEPYQWVGIEWLLISAGALYIYIRGIVRVVAWNGDPIGGKSRILGGTAAYVAQIIGSGLLIAGYASGLYIATIAITLSFASLVSGAWLLVAGVHERPS
jgi:hypothetical protein